jgi:hypothetical protein
MFKEDNSGFVYFPFGSNMRINEGNKTLIYLVSFETKHTLLSNLNISLPGDFISDDFMERFDVENVVENHRQHTIKDSVYFPNEGKEKIKSIPLISSICIGWSNDSYDYMDGNPWRASYRDLTEEGKKLYYSMKKLHNSKEVRILTFNNI